MPREQERSASSAGFAGAICWGEVSEGGRSPPPSYLFGGRSGRGAEPPSELSERLEARAPAGGDDAARHGKVGGEDDDIGIGVLLEKAATGLAG